ncbi:MAG: ABC transporter substrate-binding protein [Chloroflexi bacterium]|nr:ABC transporter substrate-binding protein [Chloroflexota bacterium]
MQTATSLRPALPPERTPRIGRLLAALVLAVACAACTVLPQSGGQALTPTPVSPPRPTAEPPAAVSTWYLAAQSEGEVRVWGTFTSRERTGLDQAFKRRYPEVGIAWRTGTDQGILNDALVAARDGSDAWDVVVADSATALKSAGLAARWTPPEGRAVDPAVIDPEGAWYAAAKTYWVLEYNTAQVAFQDRPRSYEALRDPRYDGRLSAVEDATTWLRGMIASRGRDPALDVLHPLAQQAVVVRPDAPTVSAFIAAGREAVAIANRLDAIERDRRAGAMVSWVAIEPVVVQPLAVVVSARTDRPNAARLFANFLLSRDAQAVLAEEGRVTSRTDFETDPPNLVLGIKTQVTLPPEGAEARHLRDLYVNLWRPR